MNYLHATNSKRFGRRNMVRLLVVTSCLAAPVGLEVAFSADAAKQPSVGITFKNGKVDLPAASGTPNAPSNVAVKLGPTPLPPPAGLPPFPAPSEVLASSAVLPPPAPPAGSAGTGTVKGGAALSLPAPAELSLQSVPAPELPKAGDSAPSLPSHSALELLATPETPLLPPLPAPSPQGKGADSASTSTELGNNALLPPPPLPASLTQSQGSNATPATDKVSEPIRIGLSDTTAKEPKGEKVTVKLGDSDSFPSTNAAQSTGPEKANLSDANSSNPSGTTNIRLSDATQSVGSGVAASGPMKYSLDDNGVIEHSTSSSKSAPMLQQRAPELVKPSRQSAAKVVAVPDVKDPTVASQAFNSQPADYRASATANSTGGPQVRVSVKDDSIHNARLNVPAPAANLNLPATNRNHAQNFGGGARTVVDTSTDRVHEIEVLGTYSIVMPAEITSVSAKNSGVCNVFHNGTTLTVVGSAAGKTAVEVHMAGGHRRLLTFKVSSSGTQSASPSKDIERVMQMVRQHFPTARVDFNQDPSGSITLKGYVQSESDARKILELVRKVCLVPVDDKINVMR